MPVKRCAVLRLFFLLGLFLSPFVFWPMATIPYEIPRVFFLKRWIESLGILTIIFAPVCLRRRKIDHFLITLVCFFILAVFVSSLSGIDFAKSFWGNYYRGDGLLTLFHLAGLFFFLVLFWDRSWWQPLVFAVSLSCFLISLWAIFSEIRRFGAPVAVSFGNPNFLAGYLLVCLPFLTYLIASVPSKKARLFWLLVLFCQIIAIFFTLSRAGILGIILFVLGWLILKSKKRASWYWLLPVVLVLGSSFLIFSFSSFKNIRAWEKKQIAQYLSESRERIFIKGVLAFQKRPIFGWGFANFDYAFESVDWPEKFKVDIYVDKAHSAILEVLVTTGLVGLSIYLLLIGKLLKNIYRGLKENGFCCSPTLLLALLLYLFHSQTNVISVAEELIFWLILGITASLDKKRHTPQFVNNSTSISGV